VTSASSKAQASRININVDIEQPGFVASGLGLHSSIELACFWLSAQSAGGK